MRKAIQLFVDKEEKDSINYKFMANVKRTQVRRRLVSVCACACACVCACARACMRACACARACACTSTLVDCTLARYFVCVDCTLARYFVCVDCTLS